jgi:hypothetical protein
MPRYISIYTDPETGERVTVGDPLELAEACKAADALASTMPQRQAETVGLHLVRSNKGSQS